jgi:hypothetical protein
MAQERRGPRRQATIDGLRNNPLNARPTLATHGIDENLAHQAHTLETRGEKR